MYKIAIVDDEPLMLEGFSKAIDWKAYGYEVVGAFKNAGQILAFCEKEFLDILILDIGLPGKDGITLLKEIKKKYPQIYVIMLTAHNEFEFVRESLRHRADEYLWKPEIDFADILKCMNRLMEQAQKAPEDVSESGGEFLDYVENQHHFVQERFSRLLEGIAQSMEMDNIGQLREDVSALCEMILQEKPRKTEISSGLLHIVFLYQGWLRKHGAVVAEMINEDAVLELLRKNNTCEDFVSAFANLLEEGNCYVETNQEKENDKLKMMIAAYIVKNLDQPDLNLMSLSKAFNISYSYFSRIFTEIMSKNFSKYLIELRMEKACSYLTQSNYKIERILEMVGYNDKSYFIKSFKTYTGMTPSKYRLAFKNRK